MKPSAKPHELSWLDYNGLDYQAFVALYTFDGKVVGRGDEGLRALKALDLPRGSIVRVKYPWIYEPSGPPYHPPYDNSDLIEHWERAGVVVDEVSGFRMGGEARDK